MQTSSICSLGIFIALSVCGAATLNSMEMDHSSMTTMSPMQTSYPSHCDEGFILDHAMGMCMPIAKVDSPIQMYMVHGQVFGGGIVQERPRGTSKIFSTSMVMADVGASLGERNYLNLDVMLTAEKWTLPQRGYPELLQIGEDDAQGNPYIDAQHPHNSPLMGLTLSDTITLNSGEGVYFKLFAAPRGETTDGPVAFMHRSTGKINPDAPLGHHVGQDVGHISSSVIGASLRRRSSILEFSAFSGKEPEPTKIDLPIGCT